MVKDINEIVSEYLAGTISDKDRCYLQQRMKTDGELCHQVEQLMDDRSLTRLWEIYDGVDDSRSLSRLRSRIFPTIRRHKHAMWWSAAAAVVVIITLASTWFVEYTSVTPPELSNDVVTAMQYQSVDDSNANVDVSLAKRFEASKAEVTHQDLTDYELSAAAVEELLAANKIETQRGKEHWLTLSDGTVVHLGNNTRLIYPERFATRSPFGKKVKREVYLDGEAYFMVAHDKSRPFVVHTLYGDINDYGTEFFVASSRKDTEESMLSVALVKGKVGVVPHSGKGEVMLAPGQCVQTNGESMNIDNVDAAAFQAWNTGTYELEGVTLEGLMEVIGRWYDIGIEFADSSLKAKKFDGVLSRYESLNNVLRSISLVMNLNITQSNGKIIVNNNR